MAKPVSPEWQARRQAHEAHLSKIARMPSLHLLVWPTPSCVRLSLVIYHSESGSRRSCTVLRTAEWRPAEVSERKLVEWGMKAMVSWLEEPTVELVTYEAWPKP